MPTGATDPTWPRPAVDHGAEPHGPRTTPGPGRAVSDENVEKNGEQSLSGTVAGLPIAGDAALPFLLAARAQGELAQGSSKGRAFFAEGLCSSYEAFHHTRDGRGDVRDVDDDGIERCGKSTPQDRDSSLVPIAWYEEQVGTLIPSREAAESERYLHPKIHAVVRRTINLWLAGEKVLLFCFYRETAKALRDHIGREVANATFALAAEKLRLDAEMNASRVRDLLERIARRLADEDSPFHRVIVAMLRRPLDSPEFAVLRPRQRQAVRQRPENFGTEPNANATGLPPTKTCLLHISEPTRRRGESYAVFCLKKKKQT